MLLHYLVKYLCQQNKWKKTVNDKLQGSVTTYLRRGGAVIKQIRKGLLLSLSVNFLNSKYLAKLQAKTWLSYAHARKVRETTTLMLVTLPISPI